jgi:hypothetical protein
MDKQSGQPTPFQKDPQKERDQQPQRQGGTQQEQQRRQPGHTQHDQGQQKERKSA